MAKKGPSAGVKTRSRGGTRRGGGAGRGRTLRERQPEVDDRRPESAIDDGTAPSSEDEELADEGS
jgi:hypothetical protein